jgi:hypothetical protein
MEKVYEKAKQTADKIEETPVSLDQQISELSAP